MFVAFELVEECFDEVTLTLWQIYIAKHCLFLITSVHNDLLQSYIVVNATLI